MENMALVKSAEVCTTLGISSTKLYAMTKSGEIPAFLIGRHYHYSEEEVKAWLEKQRCRPAQPDKEEMA